MEKSILGRVNAILYRGIKEILIFSGLALIALTFVGVITRYILKINLEWAYETSILILVWVAFLGAAAAARTKGHIQFDTILNILPPLGSFLFRILRDLLVMAFVVAGIYFGYKVVLKTLSQHFQTIAVPVGALYAAVPGGFIPMFLFSLEDLIRILKTGPAGSRTKEGA
jgi:TRAP-type C4-dicarboxylate transport system permease small subunit